MLAFDLEGVSYLSFDIFDTLLVRKCAPEQVFDHAFSSVITEDYTLDAAEFTQYRKRAESWAREKTSKEEANLEDIYACLPLKRHQQQCLIEAELAAEQQALVLNTPLLSLLKKAHARGIHIALISDMYLSEAQIRRLFSHLAPYLEAFPLFVSSQRNKTKRMGDLFLEVKQQLGWQCESWLHIGDDDLADVAKPRELGLKAQHLCFYPDYKQLKEQESLAVVNTGIEAQRKLASLQSTESAFKLGAMVLAPILSVFADWVIDKVVAAHAQTILCISREGLCFKQVIDTRLTQRNLDTIHAKVLYASRRSTLLPAVDLAQPNWLGQMLSEVVEYGTWRVDEFFQLLQLCVPEHISGYSHIVSGQWSNTAVGDFTLQQSIYDWLDSHIAELAFVIQNQKQALNLYLQSLAESGRVITLDFGGGGSIQAKLNQFCPNFAHAHLLFYQTSRVYRFYDSVLFSSFISESKGDKQLVTAIVNYYFVLEALFNGWQGSAVEYELQTGKPVLGAGVTPNKTLLQRVYAGVQAYLAQQQTRENKDRNDLAKAMLRRFLLNPLNSEKALFDQLYHQSVKGEEQLVAVGGEYARVTRVLEDNSETGTSIEQEISVSHIQVLTEKIAVFNHKKVAVYGAGEFFKQLLPHLSSRQIQVTHLVDRKAEMLDYSVASYAVEKLADVVRQDIDVFLIASAAHVQAITNTIQSGYTAQQKTVPEIISV